jgi:hypothetical protein
VPGRRGVGGDLFHAGFQRAQPRFDVRRVRHAGQRTGPLRAVSPADGAGKPGPS